MNAYELAEQLMTALATLENSAIMLRQLQKEKDQQADRIAELEKNLHMLQRHYDQLDHDLPNAEPVAWGMFVDGDFWDAIHNDEHNRVEGEYTIPLYTTPQIKELSDEEIDEIMKQTSNWYDFARAILKKASEK